MKTFLEILQNETVDNARFKSEIIKLLESKVLFKRRYTNSQDNIEFQYEGVQYTRSTRTGMSIEDLQKAENAMQTAYDLCSDSTAHILPPATYRSFIQLVQKWGIYSGTKLQHVLLWEYHDTPPDRPPAYVPTPVSQTREDVWHAGPSDVSQPGLAAIDAAIHPSDPTPKLDGVKYTTLMRKVLEFLKYFDQQHGLVRDERGDATKDNGDMQSSVRQKYVQIKTALTWFKVSVDGPKPWLWGEIREDVSECMKRMGFLRDEINTLDLELLC